MPKTSDAKPAKAPRAGATAKLAKPAKAAALSVATPDVAAPRTANRPAKAAGKAGNTATVPVSGIKLRDLVDSVAAATGAKKVDAKASVEATLAALATALKAGADMTLPPLGKLRVVKLAEKGGATMMTLKLRHGGGQKPGAKALADDGEDS